MPKDAAPEKDASASAADQTNSRLADVLEGLQQSIERMRTQEPGGKKSEPAAEERVYSRAELRKFVDDGRITEDQAVEYLEATRERQLEKKLTSKLERDLSTRQINDRMESRIAEFIEAKPELSDPKSEPCKQLQKRFDRLVHELGFSADDPRTKVVALEQEFGSPERLRPAPETTGKRDTRRTAGSVSAGVTRKDGSDPLHGLPSGLKTYFQGRLDSKEFKGLDDPRFLKEVAVVRSRQEARS